MKFAFCIGNGESRIGFSIDDLKQHGETYSSNGISRDTAVDHLVCCDRRMAMETVSAGYKGRVYTREDWYSFFPYNNFDRLAPLPWKEKEKWTATSSFRESLGETVIQPGLETMQTSLSYYYTQTANDIANLSLQAQTTFAA